MMMGLMVHLKKMTRVMQMSCMKKNYRHPHHCLAAAAAVVAAAVVVFVV